MTTEASPERPGQVTGSEPTPRATVHLDLDCASVLNFAMEQNGVPVVHEIAVSNEGIAPFHGATLELETRPELAGPLVLPTRNRPKSGHVSDKT